MSDPASNTTRTITVHGPHCYWTTPDGPSTYITFDEAKLINAALRAAPDLLAALKGVLRVADRKTVEFDAARDAIAKAEGVQNV